jgi:16S rRNA pseudouridine516 synthase
MNNTIRIDKYLAQLQLISRREAKKVFKSGAVMLNGYEEYDHGFLVRDGDMISLDGFNPPSPLSGGDVFEFEVRQDITILLHKPAGYVCSEIDEGGHLSYKTLLEDCIYAPLLKIAGRLDQDTTWLVLATSDGQLIHRIISPKSGKEKEYMVTCKNEVSDTDLLQLERWVIIDNDYQTLPAKTVRKDLFSFYLTITEGKFHQIKKMCEAVDHECVALHRIRIDRWTIEWLGKWEWKYI